MVAMTKGFAPWLLLFVRSVASNAVPAQSYNLSNSNNNVHENHTLRDFDGPATAAEADDPWTLSVRRGAKLLEGMKASDKDAASLYDMGDSAESPFDGDLHNT